MTIEREVAAIRTAVGVHVARDVAVVEVSGAQALTALERVLPTDLYLRDGQCRQSLILGDGARPIADVLVARDDDRYVLEVWGLTADEVLARLRGCGVEHEARPLDVAVVSVHGPWAWELMGEAFDAGAGAVPYLNVFHLEGNRCFRAGRTGEFGFEILAPQDTAEALAARLDERGARFGASRVSTEALLHCSFESWFFDPSFVPDGDVTPVELQLQWRLAASRPYVGQEVVAARLRSPTLRRLTFVVTEELASTGDRVTLDGDEVGVITRAARSLTRGDYVAHALLDARVAHGGLDVFEVRSGGRALRARTVAPPLVANRSLSVDPRRHAFECADEISFPPIARGGPPGITP